MPDVNRGFQADYGCGDSTLVRIQTLMFVFETAVFIKCMDRQKEFCNLIMEECSQKKIAMVN